MSDQLVKGYGWGSAEWAGDYILTDSSGNTIFTIPQATGLPAQKGNMQQTLFRSVTPFSTAVGTSAQVAQTYSLPANTLSSAGQAIRITAWGTYAANVNVKTVALTFGATTVATTGAVASNGTTFYIQADVFMLTGSTQTAIGSAISGTTVHANTATSPAETLSGAVTINCNATDGTSSAGDINVTGMIVEFLP